MQTEQMQIIEGVDSMVSGTNEEGADQLNSNISRSQILQGEDRVLNGVAGDNSVAGR